MASELGSSQISTLMETLPGIAHVLRSPVAEALANTIRAAARLADFRLADAEELVRYAVRRGLMAEDEGDRLLGEVTAAQQRRVDRAEQRKAGGAARGKTARPRAAKAKPAKSKSAKRPPAKSSRAGRPVKAIKRAKPVRKAAKDGRKR